MEKVENEKNCFNTKLIERLNTIAKEFNNLPSPANSLYGTIENDPEFQNNSIIHLKRKIFSLLSLCKLYESIIKIKFPLLETKAKGHMYNICGNMSIKLEYTKSVLTYINNENNLNNNKVIQPYKVMGEVLAFE